MLATFIMFGIVSAIFMLQEERLERFRLRYEEERRMYSHSHLYENAERSVQGESRTGNPGMSSADADFYKDFKGVPIYDPSKDYENIDGFEV